MSKEYYLDKSRINNSAIGWFLISPKYYRDKLDKNINDLSTAYTDEGTRTHMYILENDEFNKVYKTVKEYKKPASTQQKTFCDVFLTSTAKTVKLKALEAYKASYNNILKDDEKNAKKALELVISLKQYLKNTKLDNQLIEEDDLVKLNKIKENLTNHKLANVLLFNDNNWLHDPNVFTSNEFQINWDFKVNDTDVINCKSLIDRLIIDHTNKTIKLIDLKTTSSNDFKTSFNKYDYARQLAFYWMAITHYFLNTFKDKNLSEYKNESYIITISTIDTSVHVFKIKDDILLEKSVIISQILEEINWHNKTNNWDYTREYYLGDGSETLD